MIYYIISYFSCIFLSSMKPSNDRYMALFCVSLGILQAMMGINLRITEQL